MLFKITDGSLSLGGETILNHINFEIKGQEKVAIVGRNGAGKTTLLRLIAGELTLDRDDKREGSGRGPGIWWARDTTVGMLHQQAFPDSSKTVAELVGDERPFEFDRIFTGLGFGKEEKNKRIEEFSGGQQTKIALAYLLYLKPDLLLLDEPTNHLDMDAVVWLEEYLRSYPKAVLLVSHDRYFIDQLADIVWEISNGKLNKYVGNYSVYHQEKKKEIELQWKKYEQQQEEEERLESLVERFRHKPRKAKMARAKAKQLERMRKSANHVERPVQERQAAFTEPIVPEKLGSKTVYEMKDYAMGYNQILRKLSLRVRRGTKLGIIGPNGSGKTTFLKTLAGLLPSLGGHLLIGSGVEMGYYDQHSADLLAKNQERMDRRLFEDFGEVFPKYTIGEVRGVLAKYQFGGVQGGRKISELSGGERARYLLAKLIETRPNVLLLDEPTNHMDIPAKENMEDALSAYTGTLLFVSHDRYFIKKLASSLLIFTQDKILYYPNDYDHYQAMLQKKKENHQRGIDAIDTENQALVESFHAVPEKTRMQSPRLNTEQAYTDWQLSMEEQGLKTTQKEVESFWNRYDPVRAWEDDNYRKEMEEQWKSLNDTYTEVCLSWAEKYFDYEEAFWDYID